MALAHACTVTVSQLLNAEEYTEGIYYIFTENELVRHQPTETQGYRKY